jgi:hypothetical protein
VDCVHPALASTWHPTQAQAAIAKLSRVLSGLDVVAREREMTLEVLFVGKQSFARINDYLSRGPRYFGAGEPSDQKPTGMTIVTGSYRRKVDVAGERMGDPLKPAAHVEIWSYATNGIT